MSGDSAAECSGQRSRLASRGEIATSPWTSSKCGWLLMTPPYYTFLMMQKLTLCSAALADISKTKDHLLRESIKSRWSQGPPRSWLAKSGTRCADGALPVRVPTVKYLGVGTPREPKYCHKRVGISNVESRYRFVYRVYCFNGVFISADKVFMAMPILLSTNMDKNYNKADITIHTLFDVHAVRLILLSFVQHHVL